MFLSGAHYSIASYFKTGNIICFVYIQFLFFGIETLNNK